MELEIKVMDQFVNEEGSDQERACWRKIRSAMCEANSNAVLGEVTAETKQRDCKDCKWFSGINTMTGLGSEWPCESCRVDRWEDKNSED